MHMNLCSFQCIVDVLCKLVAFVKPYIVGSVVIRSTLVLIHTKAGNPCHKAVNPISLSCARLP